MKKVISTLLAIVMLIPAIANEVRIEGEAQILASYL